MLYLDTKIFMTSLNLTYNDKMSMASSVEVRVPFLDRELAEFVAWNVPPKLKLKGLLRPTTKYIFRQAMRDILPREVLQQPKAGFAAPVDYWLANDLKEMVDDLLSPSQIRKRGMFRPEAVRRFVDEHRSGRQDWSMQIWQFLTLELWMQTFLDGGAHKFEPEIITSAAGGDRMKQVLATRAHRRDRGARKFPRRSFCPAACWCASALRWFRRAPSARRRNLRERICCRRRKSRPDLVRDVISKVQRDGVFSAIQTVRSRLDQPQSPGYSSAGTVVAVGEGVTDLHAGRSRCLRRRRIRRACGDCLRSAPAGGTHSIA